MKKKDFLRMIQIFDDEIDMFIIDRNDLILNIQNVYYNIKQGGMGRIIIEPFGSKLMDDKDTVQLK